MIAVLDRPGLLDESSRRRVLDLIAVATDHDGVAPVSEDGILRINSGDMVSHRQAFDGEQLVGYLQLRTTPSRLTGELVVRPGQRRRGVGTALLTAVPSTPTRDMTLWAHGDLPAANALARRLGFVRDRVLLTMARDLTPPITEPAIGGEYRLRTFAPGDEGTLLALNAEAFADHPEQGMWTMRDLTRRMAEPWFDPRDLFLIERRDDIEHQNDIQRRDDIAHLGWTLSAFHWTKVHPGHPARSPSAPIGEVYVVGTARAAQGLGLGRAVTLAGLRHLRDLGLREAILYVDESNVRAVTLYEDLGFARVGADVTYLTEPSRPAAEEDA